MPKVTVVQVIYNSRRYIEPVFSAIFKQTFKDFNVVAVISGNDDGGKELLAKKFPQVEIIDPGFNIGFAAGHNLVFSAKGGSAFGGENSEFFQLVNPDLILEPTYIENILKAFEDPKVGAATGKLYKVEQMLIANDSPLLLEKGRGGILDTTGVVISKSGRARDRGQHEVDVGQYDKSREVVAISGAGPMYRRSSLESVRLSKLSTNHLALSTSYEYFDEDFHSYWEDVDLTWRMTNTGFKCVYVPEAVGYHGRAASSSAGGYLHLLDFIAHHHQLPRQVRELNYKNHIFMYLKNSRLLYPQFFVREFFMLIYVLIFETSTLLVIPDMLRLLPKIWKKRQEIKKLRKLRN